MSNFYMRALFKIRDSLIAEFKLFNCASGSCTIMQRIVALHYASFI